MPVTPKEMNHTVTLSLGFIVCISVISFSLGRLFAKNEALQVQVNNQHLELKQFVEQEVGGLRSDWERSRDEDREQIKSAFKEVKEDFLYLRDKHD